MDVGGRNPNLKIDVLGKLQLVFNTILVHLDCFLFQMVSHSSWEEFQQIGLEEESARRIFHSSQQVP